jgi:hypothetical protein
MKKFILLFVSILMLASCSNEGIVTELEVLVNEAVPNSNLSAKGGISICHKNAGEIAIGEAALQTHIDHGDAVDMDGDGFYHIDNPCSATDFDDDIPFDQSTLVDADGDGFFTTQNPFSEIDCDDTTYSEDNSCGTPATIGDLRDGGVVFWVSPDDNTHGFVVSLRDQGIAEWGCWLTDISEVNDNVYHFIGEGYNNTQAILQNCSEPGIAAEIAVNYRGGNYTDWFLPSSHELMELLIVDYLINPTLIANGGQKVVYGLSEYWGSNQRNAENAFHSLQLTYGFGLNYGEKYAALSVRAIRAF